jgi:uncharacterized protein YjbI with pentapeptide repeats
MTTMPGGDWIRRHKKTVAAASLGAAPLIVVAIGIFWFGWDWKALIGWRALVDYIDPHNATGRKDAVQVYAVFLAGVIAAMTAFVGFRNLALTRKNLEQQRELEAQRTEHQRELEAQRVEHQRELALGTALQAYYEQIGKLLTEYDLRNTQREEVRELARGQTLTVLQEVDGSGKGSLLTFLHGAGLIGTKNPAVALTGADLRGVALPRRADLRGANLQEAILQDADLKEANLQSADLRGAILQGAILQGADLQRAILLEAILEAAYLLGADLRGADLQDADLQDSDLEEANLQRAILRGASLQRANFQGADLQGVTLRRANLRGASFQGAKVTDDQLTDALYRRGATMPSGQMYEDWLSAKRAAKRTNKPRSAAGGAQEDSQRPWWRRWFGG